MSESTPLQDFLFDLRGYLLIENAIPPDLLDRLNAEFDAFPRDLPMAGWYKGAHRRDYVQDTGMELHHCLEIGGPFEELIDNPAWHGHVSKYCGEEQSYVAGLFIDECIASIRGQGGYHPVHSGNYRTPLRCKYHYQDGMFRCGQVNVLMALTDIGPGDGATLVVPGSHKSNLPHPEMSHHTYGGDKVDELPVAGVEVHMKKGDAVLFVDAIMHGGSAKTTPGERRVVIFRYGPSWGRTRYGYQYSPELIARLTPERRRVLQSVPPCLPGDNFIPQEAPAVARRERAAEIAAAETGAA